MSLSTFLRVVALSLNAAVIGMTVFVFYVHWIAYRKAKGTHAGLLPVHVMAVSLYAILKSVTGALTIFEFLHRDIPLTPIVPLHLVADVILVVGLILVFRYQRRKVRLTTVDALDALAKECEPTELYRGKAP